MDTTRTDLDPLIPPFNLSARLDYQTTAASRKSSSRPHREGRASSSSSSSSLLLDTIPPPSLSMRNHSTDSTSSSMNHPHHAQHLSTTSNTNSNEDAILVASSAGATAVTATSRGGPSLRQNFYSIRDRTTAPPPTSSSLHTPALPASDSRDYIRTHNLMVNSDSTDSSDSSALYNPSGSGQVGGQLFAGGHGEMVGPGGLQPGELPPPKQLHADYSHRLHQNQVAQGHHNFVVGGAHGRYRDYGGTLIEVPEEVFAVRQAALTVLEPITYCWLILTIGFSISVALGTARWTSKLGSLPYWAIFLPAWISHGGIVLMHILSARALSNFISEANDNRQRQDSTDHLDRVEYLPLLQRSLKFGLKTGVLCFVIFIFEILLFIRLCRPYSISLTETYVPLWILSIIFIGNGIVCKSQHFLHSVIWVLLFTAMVLSVLRADFGMGDIIPMSHIILVLIAMLSIISVILIHLIYGHQIGFYKLTDSQLTAGVFYSTSSFLAIILVAIMGDAVVLPEAIQLDLLLINVILAPIVVGLAGFGAYLVTRDEFDRLLKYGGQSSVVPMRLRLEANGWTSVLSRGAVTIPMFGDVEYEPLNVEDAERLSIELCGPCCCYPVDDEEELPYFHREDNYHSPTPPNSMAVTARWGGSEAPIV